MKSRSEPRGFAAFAILLVLLVAGSSLLSAQNTQELTKPSFGATDIVWQPLVEDGLMLTISGAETLFCESYEPGKAPRFGERFPDGVYKWEIAIAKSRTIEPKSDGSNGRDLGNPQPPQKPKTVKPLPITAGPIQSGSFSIIRGRIIDPASGKEEQQSNK